MPGGEEERACSALLPLRLLALDLVQGEARESKTDYSHIQNILAEPERRLTCATAECILESSQDVKCKISQSAQTPAMSLGMKVHMYYTVFLSLMLRAAFCRFGPHPISEWPHRAHALTLLLTGCVR